MPGVKFRKSPAEGEKEAENPLQKTGKGKVKEKG
jgi:hypothetical protein